MYNQTGSSFINSHDGKLAFGYFEFEENCFSEDIQRNSHYTLIWIKEGAGKIMAGFSEYEFQGHTLLAFSPYQPFLILPEVAIKGIMINFNAEFIYVNHNEKEINFGNGINNDRSRLPVVELDESTINAFALICTQIKTETQYPTLAQQEMLAVYVKIFLINASRLKAKQSSQSVPMAINNKEHYILQKLNDAIEDNFKSKHTPADYAELLFVSVKTLTRVSKAYFNKTVSELINNRIITEGKRELFLTNKAVKEIAYELGYEDEFYFSRFFKINTGMSPQTYRNEMISNRAIRGVA